MQEVALTTFVAAVPAEGDDALLFCDRGKIEMGPAALLEHMTDNVIGMEPLHHDDDRALGLVVEPRQQRVGVPLFQRLPGALRLGVLRL